MSRSWAGGEAQVVCSPFCGVECRGSMHTLLSVFCFVWFCLVGLFCFEGVFLAEQHVGS